VSKIYIKNNKAVGEKRKARQKNSIQERNTIQRMEEATLENTGVFAGRELYFENSKRKEEIEEQDFHTFPQVPRGAIQDIRDAQERLAALEGDTSLQELIDKKEFEQTVSVSRGVYAELVNIRNLVEAENFLSVRREIK